MKRRTAIGVRRCSCRSRAWRRPAASSRRARRRVRFSRRTLPSGFLSSRVGRETRILVGPARSSRRNANPYRRRCSTSGRRTRTARTTTPASASGATSSPMPRGRFRLATIVPGLYPGRTRHLHVKVQAPASAVLTTQLYFPGEPRNKRDGLYRPELEVKKEAERRGSRLRLRRIRGQGRNSFSRTREQNCGPDPEFERCRTRRNSSRGCAGCARRAARSSA